MCADSCDNTNPSTCQGLLTGFTCGDAGVCVPSSGTPACTPSQDYTLGSKVLGQCCAATGDLKSGTECIGGHCASWGDNPQNPFICDQVCTTASDCQAFTAGDSYDCINVGTYSLCIPFPAESSGGSYACNY
jgi:hypothetical protein